MPEPNTDHIKPCAAVFQTQLYARTQPRTTASADSSSVDSDGTANVEAKTSDYAIGYDT